MIRFILKKKKNHQPVRSCLETWTFWKYWQREGAAPRRRFSARGVMLIQCDRGIFFSQARKAESANCSAGGQPGRVQAQEAICGGWCVWGGCAGLPSPTSSISQEWFIRQLYLINSHSVLKPVNLEHQKFIVGPILSFLQWTNWGWSKGVKHLFYRLSANQYELEPSLWSCSPAKVTRDSERQLWLPLGLWFGFKSLLCGSTQVI